MVLVAAMWSRPSSQTPSPVRSSFADDSMMPLDTRIRCIRREGKRIVSNRLQDYQFRIAISPAGGVDANPQGRRE
jgi:hypothetical protein